MPNTDAIVKIVTQIRRLKEEVGCRMEQNFTVEEYKSVAKHRPRNQKRFNTKGAFSPLNISPLLLNCSSGICHPLTLGIPLQV